MKFSYIINRLRGKSARDILNESIDNEMEKKELRVLQAKLDKLRVENNANL